MFDASEILFLNTSVELNLLTPNQRDRLVSYQDQLEPGYTATQLVVDAGLMIEEEVGEVLAHLEEGISAISGGAPSPSAAPAPSTPASTAGRALDQHGPVSVATSQDVDAILQGDTEYVPSGDARDTQMMTRADAQQLDGMDKEGPSAPQAQEDEQSSDPEPAVAQPEQAPLPADQMPEEFRQPEPAFPIPGGGNPHYAGDGGESARPVGSFSAYGDQDDINAEWDALDAEEAGEEGQPAAPGAPQPAQPEPPKARELASSVDEIAALMEDEE